MVFAELEFRIFVEQLARDCPRHSSQNDPPQQHAVTAAFVVVDVAQSRAARRHLWLSTKSRDDQIDPGGEEINQYSQQCSGVQGDIKREIHRRIELAPAKEPASKNQVRRTRDR